LKRNDTKPDGWNELTSADQIEVIIAASENKPQLIYKHSHTCGICFIAKKKIEGAFDAISKKAAMHFLDVKKQRTVSEAVAEAFDVRHESPQALIIAEGECIWHASHFSIKADAILEALKKC
jgi:bacillithiol system protein YtxJ